MVGLRHIFLAMLAAVSVIGAGPALAAPAQPAGAAQAAPGQPSTPLEQAQQIDALIAGTLDPAVDPKPLLALSLTGVGAKRAQLVMKLAADTKFYNRASRKPALLTPLSADEAALALAQARFLRLPEKQRADLLAAHQRSAEQQAAKQAAARARQDQQAQEAQLSERLRQAQAEQIAREKAKLQKTRTVQAQLRTRVTQLESEPLAISDAALDWQRKVSLFSQSTGASRTEQANLLYDQLVAHLRSIRERLHNSLDQGETPKIANLDPPALDPTLPLGNAVTQQLGREQQTLTNAAETLRADYARALWSERRALRDAMVLENDQRLALIPQIGSVKRSEMLGFGSAGMAQARREVQQIILDLRFHAQEWRRFLFGAVDRFLHPTPAFVLGLLRLVFITLLFRWWRKVGDRVLARSQQELEARRPRTLWNGLQATIITYARRVRRPLDWLLFALLFRWLLPAELAVAGLDLVWIVIFWSLLTVLFVRLADALASGHSVEDPRANLRWSSLRLVAASVLGIGLVLALTSASVGKGAIYNWVLATCWLLVPAIVLVLAHWWRERIVALSKSAADKSALLGWVSRDPGGLPGLIGRVAAGTVLLLAGLQTVIARRAGDFALIRDLFEQRARSRAAQQVAEDKASGRFHRPPPDILDMLDPHRLPAQSQKAENRPGKLVLPTARPGTLTMVIGGRGLGKSALLRDLGLQHKERHGDEARIVALRVDARGLDGLLADLGAALGLTGEAALPDALVAHLSGLSAPMLVTIDDIQRLTVAAIGGLAMLDELVDLARRCGTGCAWVFAIGGPAWSYVSRARADRVLFDETVRLPRWSAAELRALIERRTEQAGVDPDFSGMIDEGAFRFNGEMNADVRRRIGYFERMSDYADGNPAIALEYWRRSLFIDEASGRVTVRTFATPGIERLAALPTPAMFVLRAIVQMDLVDAETIHRSTDLPTDVIADALRSLTRLGTVAAIGDSYRVTLFWWIEAMRLLRRQNLIAREAS